MANFPTSLDSFVNPSSSDTMSAVGHAAQHANVNDAVEALEAKLGIGASTPASGKLLRGTGAGQSAWDKDAPTGDIVGTSDTQTLTNKTLTSPTINTAIISNPTLTVNTIAEHTAASGVTVDGLLIKDSKLATNNSVVTSNITDDAVTAAKLDWATTGANGGIWWEEIGRTTLGASSDTLTVSSLPARKYLKYYASLLATGGTINVALTYNGDTGNNYARRFSNTGAADTTGTGLANMSMVNAQAAIVFIEFGAINIQTQEKLTYWLESGGTASGAGSIPDRTEGVGKWANTSAQISSITFTNSGTGDYAAGSEIVVLGHN